MNSVKAMYRTRNILASTISEIVVGADPQQALVYSYREFPDHNLDAKTVISLFAQSGFVFDLQLGTISGARPIS
jgi:hypothetical protein